MPKYSKLQQKLFAPSRAISDKDFRVCTLYLSGHALHRYCERIGTISRQALEELILTASNTGKRSHPDQRAVKVFGPQGSYAVINSDIVLGLEAADDKLIITTIFGSAIINPRLLDPRCIMSYILNKCDTEAEYEARCGNSGYGMLPIDRVGGI